MSFTRYFTRPKSSHWDQRVHCTPIGRALKMWFNDRTALYEYCHPLPSKGSLSAAAVLFLAKNKYLNSKRFWSIFCHKARVSTV